MTSAIERIQDWTHSFVAKEGTLAEIIKSVERQIDNLSSMKNIVEDNVHVETAQSLSIDAIGALLDVSRRGVESDTAYRNRLLIAVSDVKVQTVDTIEDVVEWITGGYIPTVEEYPAYSDVEPGSFRIRLPINMLQYSKDMHSQIDRVKGAGIAVIIERLEEWIELINESVIVDDMLDPMGLLMISDTIPNFPISGSKDWDYANWDTSDWDGILPATDRLWVGFMNALVDAFTAGITDVLGGVITGYLTDSLAVSLVDEILLQGLLDIGESFTVLGSEDLYLSGMLYQSESYTESITDVFMGILLGYLTDSFSEYTDELSHLGLKYETDQYVMGWDGLFWDYPEWDGGVGVDVFALVDAIHYKTETITAFDELMDLLGVITLTDTLDASLVDEVLYFLIGYFSESLSIFDDELDLDGMGLFIETFTNIVEDLKGLILGYFTETVSSYPDGLSQTGLISFSETSSTPTEEFIALFTVALTESYERKSYAKIGTAKIGVDKIGWRGAYIYYDHGWDEGLWDEGFWDHGTDDVVVTVEDGF